MTSGGPRRGRRDNGLVAAAYAVAGDVDPRVGEHLLDVLGLRGIAAYLQPTADLHPVTRTTTLPERPIDRLYVDREHLATARRFLDELGGEPPEPSMDDLFAGIVAGFNQTAAPGDRPWPAAEDLADEPAGEPAADDQGTGTGVPPAGGPTGSGARTDRPDPPTGPTGTGPIWRPVRWTPPPDQPSLLDGLDTFGAGLPEDEEEGYTPPPPPPLPRLAPITVLAVLAILAGIVVFFHPTLLPIDESVSMVLGFLGILTGFVILIWRLRPGTDDDDPWDDDGAVV